MPNIDPHENVYTIKDAAKRFSVKPSDIYQAIKNEELPASQIPDGLGRHGWKYMIFENDLKKWINGDTEEEPIHINASFTPISELLKEGQSMTAEEMQKKLDNAVVDEPVLMTVEEAAKYIGWSTWKVRTLIKKGELLFEKQPRHGGYPNFTYAILKDSCDAYIAEHGKGTEITYKPRKKNTEDIVEPVEKKEEPKEIIAPVEVAAGVEFTISGMDDIIASINQAFKQSCTSEYAKGFDAGYKKAKEEFEQKLSKLKDLLKEYVE